MCSSGLSCSVAAGAAAVSCASIRISSSRSRYSAIASFTSSGNSATYAAAIQNSNGGQQPSRQRRRDEADPASGSHRDHSVVAGQTTRRKVPHRAQRDNQPDGKTQEAHVPSASRHVLLSVLAVFLRSAVARTFIVGLRL